MRKTREYLGLLVGPLLRPWKWGKVPKAVLGAFLAEGGVSSVSKLSAEVLKLNNAKLAVSLVQASKTELSGSSSISGTLLSPQVEAKTNRAYGLEEVSLGRVEAQTLLSNGSLYVLQDAKVEGRVEAQGELRLGGDLTTQRLQVKGLFKAQNVRADSVEILLGTGQSSAVSIEAKEVSVAQDKSLSRRWMSGGAGTMEIDSLAADSVKIAGCKVITLKGGDVIVGENCDIVTLEFSGKLSLHNQSQVRNIIDGTFKE
jgi:cytoskeletal protein CcmA (bactofilin family)